MHKVLLCFCRVHKVLLCFCYVHKALLCFSCVPIMFEWFQVSPIHYFEVSGFMKGKDVGLPIDGAWPGDNS